MSHSHDHAQSRANFGVAFATGIVLNIGIVVFQVIFGLLAHSTALLADAAHNASDVIGLVLAWTAYLLAKKSPFGTFTYGMRSGTLIASLGNGMLLLFATGAIAWEALLRFFHPVAVEGGIVLAVAALAIAVNGFSAWLLSGGSKRDINTRGAYWHLISDAAVSAGVVISAFLMMLTGWLWLDPLTSLLIAAAILWSTWGLIRESLRLSMLAAPETVDVEAVRGYLASVPGVQQVHDLHIWPISTSETALTAHLVVAPEFDPDTLSDIADHLEHDFHIDHPTIQLEAPDGKPCRLASDTAI